ncbi:short-chain dehydrogenase [Aspergillus ustus]|uniref:Short-chain dehydrogenase n=1 Tax=Aspergillus ustus TaxID=40382 RepID=A0A0C1EFQ1_ASPUT|nr:short-chain dehydrogenase [Aspergillus ustus]
MSTAKPLILITGANQGLGFASAKQLVSTGKYRLILGARSQEKAEAAVKELGGSEDLTPVVIDLDSDRSIEAAAAFVKERFGSLDILINNAGINRSSDPNATLRETYRAVFETNVFGVAVMVENFLPLLRASQYHDRRIVNVTSGLGQIGIAYSPTSEYSAKVWELPVYRGSKAALNIINAVDAVRLREEKILSVVAAPGYCRTNFGGYTGVKDPEDGARPIVRAAVEGSPDELFGTIVDDENFFVEFGW